MCLIIVSLSSLLVLMFIMIFLLYELRLEQKWIEVTTDTQVDALINAVHSGLKTNTDSTPGVFRTMVFANTVEAAEAIANILVGAGIKCVRYHRDISLEERTENLVDFQQNGGVFVCTDAAARGLDIPNISHVIQVCLSRVQLLCYCKL